MVVKFLCWDKSPPRSMRVRSSVVCLASGPMKSAVALGPEVTFLTFSSSRLKAERIGRTRASDHTTLPYTHELPAWCIS